MRATRRHRYLTIRAAALAVCALVAWQAGAGAQESPPPDPTASEEDTPTSDDPSIGDPVPGADAAPVEEDPTKPRLDVRLGGLATGVRLVFSRPNTLPFDPLLPVSLGAASSIIDDGTSETRGFASAVYPGDILANVAGLAGLVGFPVGGQVLPPDHPVSQFYKTLPGLVPPWPFAVRGSFPGDPGRRVDVLSDVTRGVIPLPVPVVLQGAVQEVNVSEGFVSALAFLQRVQIANPSGALGLSPVLDQAATFLKPFVGDVDVVGGDLIALDGIRARVEASDSGTKATSDAETTVSRILLLGGLMELAGIRSAVSEASEGSGTAVRHHGVTVDTVRLLGVNVRLTHEGVEIRDTRIPTGALGTAQDQLNRAFSAMRQGGLSLKLPNATSTGPTRANQTLEIRLYGQNPTIPFVATPSTSVITVAIGEAASRLEAELIPPLADAGLGGVPGGGATAAPPLTDEAPDAETFPAGSGADVTTTPGAPDATAPGASARGEAAAAPAARSRVDPLAAITDRIGDLVRRMTIFTAAGALLAGGLWRRRFGFR